jgi:hypothetical protein
MTFPNHDARMPVQQMPPEGLLDPTRKTAAAQENFSAHEKSFALFTTLWTTEAQAGRLARCNLARYADGKHYRRVGPTLGP